MIHGRHRSDSSRMPRRRRPWYLPGYAARTRNSTFALWRLAARQASARVISSCFDWKQSARANGWTKKSDVELVEALVSCLLTKQIMTSNEDAETGYKPLKKPRLVHPFLLPLTFAFWTLKPYSLFGVTLFGERGVLITERIRRRRGK